jgi:cyclophilin family peptidyl-prolyl cis-trans isomerase
MKLFAAITASLASLLMHAALAQTPALQQAQGPAQLSAPLAAPIEDPAVGQTNEAAEPAPLPSVTITLNGRPTQIEVENLSNPLVLIQTTRGDMVVELFPAEAPLTVENFLGLAEGSKPFIDPATGAQVLRPFYDGLAFHRIMPGFVVQGGSPTGGGDGGPGFVVPDEINAQSLGLDQMSLIDPEGYPNPLLGIGDQASFQQTILKPLYTSMGLHSDADLARRSSEVETRLRGMSLKDFYELLGYRYSNSGLSRAPLRGMLAMAGSGPGTAGSQFFFTLADAPWLAGRHTVFGKLRAGQSVLDTIARVPLGPDGSPMESITILLIRRIAL